MLLVEDHPVNRTVLTHQLDLIGFHVDPAPDGQVALEMFRAVAYGLVLTDLNMPGLDGYELTAAIRRHEEANGAGRTPILALSANVMQGEPEKCTAAGMDDFVAKPTTIPFLGGQAAPVASRPGLAVSADGAGPARPTAEIGQDDIDLTDRAIDVAALDELTGGDPEVAAEVLQDFLGASRADVEALRIALGAGDFEGVRRQAHRIKGASRLVGARRLAEVAEEIESLADGHSGGWIGDPTPGRRAGRCPGGGGERDVGVGPARPLSVQQRAGVALRSRVAEYGSWPPGRSRGAAPGMVTR